MLIIVIYNGIKINIDHICSQSKKRLGLLFRKLYYLCSPHVLLKLYLSLVLPHLTYCSSLWDPYSNCGIKKLESVQFFALKLCSKQWDCDYQSLLLSFHLPSLLCRRRSFKLILLYKFIYKLLYIPSTFQSRTSYSLQSYHPLNLKVPYTCSSATFHSFLPSTISLWNSLPAPVKCVNSIKSLKSELLTFFNSS